jgi:hypothetical protein
VNVPEHFKNRINHRLNLCHIEDFINSNKISIYSLAYREDDMKRRLLILLNINKIVQHLFNAIKFENTNEVAPIFNKEKPLKTTKNHPRHDDLVHQKSLRTHTKATSAKSSSTAPGK